MSTARTVSPYDILRVSPQAGDEDIRRAFHRLALEHHPDRHPQNRRLAELRFRLITEAYENLKTPERRARQARLHTAASAPARNDNMHTNFWSWLLAPASRKAAQENKG